jgi:hypothetical protein
LDLQKQKNVATETNGGALVMHHGGKTHHIHVMMVLWPRVKYKASRADCKGWPA